MRTLKHASVSALVFGMLLVAAYAAAQDRGVQLTPDGRRVLVNKDVGSERWAIGLNEDGTATGNVFRADGGDPAFIFCAPLLGPNAFTCAGADACTAGGAQRGIQRTPDGKRELVNKDVGAERWAITLNDDGTATGNVFRSSGGPPAFVFCGPLGPPNEFACFGADECATDRCTDQYTFIANVSLPPDFFQPPTPCGSGYTHIADVVLPPAFFVPPRPTLEFVTLGTASLSGGQRVTTEINVSSEVASLMLMADAGMSRVAVEAFEFPSGPVTPDSKGIDPESPTRPFRVPRTWPINVVSVPNTPLLPLETGRHRLTLTTDAPSAIVSRTALLNRRTSLNSGRLDLRVFLVAIPGVDAATAPNDPIGQAVRAGYQRKLAGAGVQLGTVAFQDFPPDRGLALTAVDLNRDFNGNSLPDQVEELFSLPRPMASRTLDLFVIQEFVGANAIGFAGAIPGPAIAAPSGGSGVVAALLVGASGAPQDVAALVQTIVHETGHYLGLYHPTEGAPGFGDPLKDTPFCDGLTMASAPALCPDVSNLMFRLVFEPQLEQSTLTPDQAFVLRRHPLIYD